MKLRASSALLVLAVSTTATGDDVFRPFASLTYTYDDNLFRLADDERTRFRDDRYGVLTAGLNVDWKPGRQQVVAKASKTLIRYDQNTFLDFEGDDLHAAWNWQFGNRLSGALGAASSSTQSSFEDIVQVNNQVDRDRAFARAEWSLHPRWRLGGGVDRVENTNSEPSQDAHDFDQQAQDLMLEYRTPKASSVRLQVRRVEADFPNPQILARVPGLPFAVVADNSFTQDEYNVFGDWRVGAKLALHGRVGWVSRDYENVLRQDMVDSYYPSLAVRPDFSGYTGRIGFDFLASGKTLVNVLAYRELGGAKDINASSVLKKGASVNTVWQAREKWRFSLGALFEDRDFRGDTGSGLPQESDETLKLSSSAGYAFARTIALDLGIQGGRRESSVQTQDYSFRSVFASLRAEF